MTGAVAAMAALRSRALPRLLTAASIDADEAIGFNAAAGIAGGSLSTGGSLSPTLFGAYTVAALFDAVGVGYTNGGWFAVSGNNTGAIFTSVKVGSGSTRARTSASAPNGAYDAGANVTYWLWPDSSFGITAPGDYDVTII